MKIISRQMVALQLEKQSSQIKHKHLKSSSPACTKGKAKRKAVQSDHKAMAERLSDHFFCSRDGPHLQFFLLWCRRGRRHLKMKVLLLFLCKPITKLTAWILSQRQRYSISTLDGSNSGIDRNWSISVLTTLFQKLCGGLPVAFIPEAIRKTSSPSTWPSPTSLLRVKLVTQRMKLHKNVVDSAHS